MIWTMEELGTMLPIIYYLRRVHNGNRFNQTLIIINHTRTHMANKIDLLLCLDLISLILLKVLGYQTHLLLLTNLAMPKGEEEVEDLLRLRLSLIK